MSLIDEFEEVFFKKFSELNMSNLYNFVEENKKTIIFLCNSDCSFNKKIEKALGEFIIKKEVQENYYPKLLRGRSPESLGYPEYLAYALKENIFSFDQLRKINLDYNSWKNEFIEKYSDRNLLKNFRERLLSFSE
ncbi:MAG: hypothetical protein ABIE36_00595 [Candidatus Diapherotrites archaeon]